MSAAQMNTEQLIDRLRVMGASLCIAESCTGGLLSAAITDVYGCSDVFLQAQITYANAAKRKTLAVPADMLDIHGAVSAEVATAMAVNAARQGHGLMGEPCLGLATTGVAGPAHSERKPIGMVFISAAYMCCDVDDGRPSVRELSLVGGRAQIRQQTVDEMLLFAANYLCDLPHEGLR